MTKPLETKLSFPPRLFGAPDLIEDIRKPGVWCAFEKPYAQTDTEYISLDESEHREKEAYARGRADALNKEADYWLEQCEMCLDTDQNPEPCRREFNRVTNLAEAARAETEGLGE